ncbi:metalloregulator ArsR/SmtB family transcription factor [Arthrobacter agilis]|uniref:ArsR/SmtB family transcription factor n=1 Tax=Arthrobacter agilis TaxID=37921 RepID=UPI002366CFF3|nr:metalloregulator ArsR/SmtB family transcription factor [Arthrobacter agilis]WDF32872.1 metalloregulator ArsR/SmtB family transcription factor [Arthrobacter agilis]
MGIDGVFAVIAEGTRRQILESLRAGDKAVGELVVELQVSQPTVSKHLKVLREAGLVTMRAQGQKRFYSLETTPLERVQEWLSAFTPIGAATPPSPSAGGAMDEPIAPIAPIAPLVSDGSSVDGGLLAAAVLAGPVADGGDAPVEEEAPAGPPVGIGSDVEVSSGAASRPPIGRTVGRAAERAADLISQLRRRRDPSA